MKQQHFRNEKDYYEFLDYINKECEAGRLSTDEKDLMIQMATNEESTRRRTEREALKSLLNVGNIKEGEAGYYSGMIYKLLDEKYYNCEYTFQDLRKADNICFLPCMILLKENNTQKEFDDICKLIFEDIKKNVIDLRNLSGTELYKIYTQRI